MIEVDDDGQAGIGFGRFDELHEVDVLGILAGAGADLQNQGRVFFLGGFRDALDNFHVIDVERTDGVAAFVRFFEHIARVYDRHKGFPPM